MDLQTFIAQHELSPEESAQLESDVDLLAECIANHIMHHLITD